MTKYCGLRIADCGIKAMLFFLLAPLFLALVPITLAAQDAPAQHEVVLSVESHYRDLSDLTAHVVQKNELKSIGKTQTFEGTLYLKKPGRLRIDYTNGQVIVLDGKSVLLYSKKGRQAVKRTFMDIAQANIPVAFLLDAADIRSEFEVVERTTGAVRHTLDLTPMRKHAAMKRIALVCDETGRISAMTVYDPSGNSSELLFTDVKENSGLTDKQFEFKIPKGTEIIEQ